MASGDLKEEGWVGICVPRDLREKKGRRKDGEGNWKIRAGLKGNNGREEMYLCMISVSLVFLCFY